jgi:ssoIM
MNAYLEYDANTFRGKTVLLPCDDPEWSNFTKYFAQNFTRLGLKKLISTGYAIGGGRGKIFTVDSDINGDGVIDIDDLKWEYLEGSGDFRSDEVKKLRGEADIIVTNPPFSLFREFFDWIMEGQLKFAVITNKNSVTCKNIFNYVKVNKIWSGKTRWSNEMRFKNDGEMKSVSAIWITNLEHGRRHQPMQLMTMADNRKFNKRVTKNKAVYQKYDNYNAIEVSYTEAIPSDYDKIMGVPISFLDKYCPEQFEILGVSESQGIGLSNGIWDSSSGKKHPLINGNKMYVRIFIKHKR